MNAKFNALARYVAEAALEIFYGTSHFTCMEQKNHLHNVSPEQLAAIGNGFLAYVKPIGAADAALMLGQPVQAGPEGKLFVLFNANGAPISISQSYEAAVDNAAEHELVTTRMQ